MARKTIDVDDVRRKANDLLAISSNDPDTRPSRQFRVGIELLVEHVLMSTDQYAGFQYLETDDDAQLDDDSLRRYLSKGERNA